MTEKVPPMRHRKSDPDVGRHAEVAAVLRKYGMTHEELVAESSKAHDTMGKPMAKEAPGSSSHKNSTEVKNNTTSAVAGNMRKKSLVLEEERHSNSNNTAGKGRVHEEGHRAGPGRDARQRRPHREVRRPVQRGGDARQEI